MEINNRTVRLNKRPSGLPEKNTWSFNEENFDLKLNENQFIIKNDFISLDPAMRGWLNDARSYIKPVQVGEVMRAGSVGKVIKSNNKYEVEFHKKFSLPAACILFVMTGASLGVLFRKGGFTIAVGLSFGFFLIYYILMIVGEDLADRNIVSPVIGVWSPNAILLIISMYLILHTVKEQAPLRASFSFLKKLLKNSGRPKNNS